MKKIFFWSAAFLMFASFITTQKVKVYTEWSKALKNPKKVKVLDLANYSTSHKNLPEELKQFINLEELYLKPPKVVVENQYGHARHYAEKEYQKKQPKREEEMKEEVKEARQ